MAKSEIWVNGTENIGSLGVQVVSTSLTAIEFYGELDRKYKSLMTALYGHGGILDFVS